MGALANIVSFALAIAVLSAAIIFTLRFLDGKDYRAICAETGTSRIAVWKHLSHIVKVLKENINTPEP